MVTRFSLNSVPDVVAHTLGYLGVKQDELKDQDGVGFTYNTSSTALATCSQVCNLWRHLSAPDFEAKNKDFWANLPAWMASSVHVVEVQTGRKVTAFTPQDRRAAERLVVDYVRRRQYLNPSYNKSKYSGRLDARVQRAGSITHLQINYACYELLVASNLRKEVHLLAQNATPEDPKIHEANQGNALLSRVTHLDLSTDYEGESVVPPPEVYLCKNVQSLVIGCGGAFWSLEKCFQLFPKLQHVYCHYSEDRATCQKICNTRNAWITYTTREPDSCRRTGRVSVGPGVSKEQDILWISDVQTFFKANLVGAWLFVTLTIRSLWWRFCQWIRGIPLEQRAPKIEKA